ncbi:MAG: hypothetical protein JF627_00645 [Alphaproteobacteria bacterium]|nr:hypothetical protein [Alphaproteobacteria bacterium]
MKKTGIIAIGLTALAISACAPAYYDRYDRPYDRYGYYGSRDRDYDGVPNYADRRPNDPYRY